MTEALRQDETLLAGRVEESSTYNLVSIAELAFASADIYSIYICPFKRGQVTNSDLTKTKPDGKPDMTLTYLAINYSYHIVM